MNRSFNISVKHFLNNLVILITILFSIASCAKKKDNFNNPFYLQADNYYKTGRYKPAADSFKKYLTLFPNSAKANYKLASIYQEQEDYIQSIYYFKRYLTLKPDSADREVIEKWIKASEASLFKKLGEEYSDSELAAEINNTEDTTLKKQLEDLQKKNELMRNFILKHKDSLIEKRGATRNTADNADSPKESNSGSQEKTAPQKRNTIYRVKEGDNLYKISNKIYGSGKHYKLIWEKNKDKFTKPSDLHPGDILIIPPLKDEG